MTRGRSTISSWIRARGPPGSRRSPRSRPVASLPLETSHAGRADMLGFEVHGHSTAVEIGEEDVVVGVRLQIRYEVTSTPNGALWLSA